MRARHLGEPENEVKDVPEGDHALLAAPACDERLGTTSAEWRTRAKCTRDAQRAGGLLAIAFVLSRIHHPKLGCQHLRGPGHRGVRRTSPHTPANQGPVSGGAVDDWLWPWDGGRGTHI